jgi:polygalacturonase
MKLLLYIILIFASQTTPAQTFTHNKAKKQAAKAWKYQLPAILQRIKPPQFAEREIVFAQVNDVRNRLQQAIDSLSQLGGGKIVVAPGNYICNGPLHLKSNIHLYLSKAATIRFSSHPAHYLPVVKVRWEGTVCYNYSPLIYAYQQKNIAVSGRGVLDGGAGELWHTWKKQPDGNDQEKDKKILRDMGRDGVAEEKRIFGDGHKLRPSLIELYECENILLEGITLQQSPFWTTHPVFCKNITIRQLTIKKGTTNDDGIDPDGCEDVLIENCVIDTDDDPIAIKAGRDNDAWNRRGTKNVVIRNIVGSSRVGNGFCIGSEMSGGVQNVFVYNYQVVKADNGINIKSNLDRGGFVKQLYFKNITVDTAIKTGLLMQKDYHSYRGGNYPPKYSDIYFEGITIKYVQKKGVRIAGVPAQNISGVWIQQLKINKQGEEDELKYIDAVIINAQNRQ